jgi:uncharacterized protein with HEPN domain
MSRHDDGLRLRHMLAHASEAIEMARGRAREDLDRDRQFSLALVRLLEIVGEAAANVSGETQHRLGTIPWPDIVRMRDRLIHGYDKVDLDIVWEVVQADLPPLVAELRQGLALESP